MKLIAFSMAALLCAALPVAARADDDLRQAPSCKYCGMDRAKYAHSRMFIDYEDGTSVGVCSLHCAAIELANSIEPGRRASSASPTRSHTSSSMPRKPPG